MFLCVYLHFGIFDVYRINSNIEICFFVYIYILVYLTFIESIKYWNMFLCVYLHFGIFDVYRINQILKYVSLRIFTFWYIWRLENKSNIEICFFAYIYILVYLTSIEWIKYWNMFLCVYLHFGIFDVYRINQILKYVSLRIFTFWYIWRL